MKYLLLSPQIQDIVERFDYKLGIQRRTSSYQNRKIKIIPPECKIELVENQILFHYTTIAS